MAINKKAFSLVDDIIEKFNIRYANADKELSDMVENLSSDDILIVNVRDSSPSAYEAAVADRVKTKITDGFLEGTLSGNNEKAEFYTEKYSDNAFITDITNAVIRKIKDLLLVG